MAKKDKINHLDIDSLDGYQPLPVAYQLRAAILQRVRQGKDPLPDIQGRQETKRDVLRALLSGHNIYLVSEEGTGKTRLAKSLTKLLPPIPRLRGCPYNDDPKWPHHLLCPHCRDSKDPIKKYGLEIIPGEKRFSRIQGNDYTDESKLLGLKDIQAIIKGKSPTDIKAFAATGAFRANRGILFIDELPAIRTKVQVLLHPISEERKAILEEYNWEHPLDNVIIATGNPQGFSHINEVPRPLLDRLELIYMPLPDKEIEREIMLRERFKLKKDYFDQEQPLLDTISRISLDEIERQVILPWWILFLLNEALDYSRRCSMLDKKPSIRGSYRALDHTYASAEMANRKVAHLEDASYGLKLALRGRMELRPDLMDFDNPQETFKRTDELSEDLLWNALENVKESLLAGSDRDQLARDICSFWAEEGQNPISKLPTYKELHRVVEQMKRIAKEKVNNELLNQRERELVFDKTELGEEVLEQYNYSAVETVSNAALLNHWITEAELTKGVFVPKLVSWAKPRV
jgi:MoxR-like ATPase